MISNRLKLYPKFELATIHQKIAVGFFITKQQKNKIKYNSLSSKNKSSGKCSYRNIPLKICKLM